MKRAFALFFGGIVLLAASCAPKATKKSTARGEFEDDLARYRPQYEAPAEPLESFEEVERNITYPAPSADVTRQVTAILDTIAARNEKINAVQGYTVIIRGGNREEAFRIRQIVLNILPSSNPQYIFDPPNHKIKVGQYYTRYEANKVYSQIKAEFPRRTILAPETIYLN